jgi:hypothetical protein
MFFYRDEVVSLMPQPSAWRIRESLWSDLSLLTRPAWDALLVTYVTASMALRFIWARKHHHCDIEIPAGELVAYCFNISDHY